MEKPYTRQDMAFQLYMHNYAMERIIFITDTDETTINEWIAAGNWRQLKENLDKTPLLRDLGRKVDTEHMKLTLLGFIGYVMQHDAPLAGRLIKATEKFFTGEASLVPLPDRSIQN